MGFSPQEEILLSIYSIDYLLKCKVNECSERILKLTPLSGKVDMFQLHDPVVLMVNSSNDLEISAADVTGIDKLQSMVILKLREKEVYEERRVFERYAVSLAVSARRRFSSKRIQLAVRDISLYGMGVVSQAELDEEELIDIDLITDRNMFYFSGQVIWKNSLGECSEYGLKLTNYDVATKYSFEEFLGKQKDRFIYMMSKAR